MKLDPHARHTLLAAARWTIEHDLGIWPNRRLNSDALSALQEPHASFVTLTRHGSLRGCMGSLDIKLPLLDDVMQNAHAAAFLDPRFPSVEADELPRLKIEISVLSAPETIPATNRATLLRALRPHQDGVILEAGAQRATFLPSVWDTLPEPRQFLDALVQKAGWMGDYWPPDLRCFRYQTDSFQEENAA